MFFSVFILSAPLGVVSTHLIPSVPAASFTARALPFFTVPGRPREDRRQQATSSPVVSALGGMMASYNGPHNVLWCNKIAHTQG